MAARRRSGLAVVFGGPTTPVASPRTGEGCDVSTSQAPCLADRCNLVNTLSRLCPPLQQHHDLSQTGFQRLLMPVPTMIARVNSGAQSSGASAKTTL
jgi:hypothetical protein